MTIDLDSLIWAAILRDHAKIYSIAHSSRFNRDPVPGQYEETWKRCSARVAALGKKHLSDVPNGEAPSVMDKNAYVVEMLEECLRIAKGEMDL